MVEMDSVVQGAKRLQRMVKRVGAKIEMNGDPCVRRKEKEAVSS